jgi:transposase
LYSDVGQPSISRRLPGAAITDFYSVRSKRLLMERLDYNLLFGWFVG